MCLFALNYQVLVNVKFPGQENETNNLKFTARSTHWGSGFVCWPVVLLHNDT